MDKLPKKKAITTDDLAAMTQRGFDGVDKQFEKFRDEMNDRFHEVHKRFDVVDSRLDRIEFMVSGHDRRLDKLEDQMLIVKTLFEKKLSIQFPK